MFTGIIEATGTVAALTLTHPDLATLTLTGPDWLGRLDTGASVAVDGACLTVVASAATPEPTADFEVMRQTLALTGLGGLRHGDTVNLERAVSASGRLDGHLVTGHVDATGRVLSTTEDPGSTRLRIAVPRSLEALVARRGSLAVDGVSLTVSDVSAAGAEEPWAEVSLIPETLRRTGLGAARAGAVVNLEVDLLARYAHRREEVARTRGAAPGAEQDPSGADQDPSGRDRDVVTARESA